MLAFGETLIYTHDDFNPWADVEVGFDDDANFIVLLDYTDYEEPSESYKKRLVLSRDEAFYLADKLGTTLTRLPKWFVREWGQENNTLYTASESVALFHDIKKYLSAITGIKCKLR